MTDDLEYFKGKHEERLEEIEETLLELSSMKSSINRKKDDGDDSHDDELERIEELITSIEEEKEGILLELKDIEEEIEKLEAAESEDESEEDSEEERERERERGKGKKERGRRKTKKWRTSNDP
ncbi:hypothetical protein K449DRAFT_388737 [Hypoxylon sp. EC38]|nr:hypothetical protein K449DRAFT_388737 [Hypoxylon sp. EC38]